MQSITLSSKERKDLIRLMKRERKPSSRLRMHIVLLAADGYSPTHICRVLFCSRTTVYTIITGRFLREGQEAFYDHRKRGLRALLDELAQKAHRVVGGRALAHRARLVALALELLCDGIAAVSRASPAR